MQGLGDGRDTPSHPGYVQGTKPLLPTPRDASGLRAKPSETFKVIYDLRTRGVLPPSYYPIL